MQEKLISYLESQRRDAQWGLLGQTLIEEVVATLGADDARRLFVQAGMRAAQQLSLAECDSVSDMEMAANHHWACLGLGAVSFTEQQECLAIHHTFIPADSPSPADLAAFFEGVYQQWFTALGAGSQLQVRQHEAPDEGTFFYRLAV